MDDCDLCEFAHFLSTFIRLEKKKLTKQQSHVLPSFCHSCIQLLVTRMVSRSDAATEIDVTFDFAIYLCSQKKNKKIERGKNLPKCFSLMVTFFIFAAHNLCCFHVANFVADGNFIIYGHFLKTSLCSSLKLCIDIYLLSH